MRQTALNESREEVEKMDLDNGVNSIVGAILEYPTAAMLLVAFLVYLWRERRPY